MVPLLVFDPGGNGSIEEVRALGCNLGDVSPGRIQISSLRTRIIRAAGNDMCLFRRVHMHVHVSHARRV